MSAPAIQTNLELVERFLQEKEGEGLGSYHLRDLRCLLARLARGLECPFTEASRDDLRAWLDSLHVCFCTWNNLVRRLAVFFRYLVRRGMLPRDWDHLPERKKLRPHGVDIWAVSEMRLLLERAPQRLVPLLALGAFAGLRTEEIRRLRWENFSWAKQILFLRREQTKTQRCRTVPISENLRAWLAPWRIASGPVCALADPWKPKASLARSVGLKWRCNALRHSYGSYRLALVQDLQKVSLEMGNSPNIIQAHYMELVGPEAAAAWFAIEPAAQQGILKLEFVCQ